MFSSYKKNRAFITILLSIHGIYGATSSSSSSSSSSISRMGGGAGTFDLKRFENELVEYIDEGSVGAIQRLLNELLSLPFNEQARHALYNKIYYIVQEIIKDESRNPKFNARVLAGIDQVLKHINVNSFKKDMVEEVALHGTRSSLEYLNLLIQRAIDLNRFETTLIDVVNHRNGVALKMLFMAPKPINVMHRSIKNKDYPLIFIIARILRDAGQYTYTWQECLENDNVYFMALISEAMDALLHSLLDTKEGQARKKDIKDAFNEALDDVAGFPLLQDIIQNTEDRRTDFIRAYENSNFTDPDIRRLLSLPPLTPSTSESSSSGTSGIAFVPLTSPSAPPTAIPEKGLSPLGTLSSVPAERPTVPSSSSLSSLLYSVPSAPPTVGSSTSSSSSSSKPHGTKRPHNEEEKKEVQEQHETQPHKARKI